MPHMGKVIPIARGQRLGKDLAMGMAELEDEDQMESATASVSPRTRKIKHQRQNQQDSDSESGQQLPSGLSLPRLPRRTMEMPLPPSISLSALLSDSRDQVPQIHVPTCTGEEPVTLYNCPVFVRYSLDRIRAQVESAVRPSMGTVACLAIHVGLTRLEFNGDIQGLLEIKHNLDTIQDIDSALVDLCLEWFLQFPLSFSDANLGRRIKLNLNMSAGLKKRLDAYRGDIGLTLSNLGLTALLYGLKGQGPLLEGYEQAIDRLLDSFEYRLEMRRGMSETFFQFIRNAKGRL